MKVKIYDKIINAIEKAIRTGHLKPGEKLPTYSELATQYSTSIVTVRKSIASLINKGYLTTVERVGTFVRERETDSYLISFAPQSNINEALTACTVEGINLSLMHMRDSKEEMKAAEIRQIYYADSIPICYNITSLLLRGHYNNNTLPDMVEKNLPIIQKILKGFEVKKVLEITMDSPNRYVQNKLLLDESVPSFCLTTYYYTNKDEPVGKSLFYAAGENIDLFGKLFIK